MVFKPPLVEGRFLQRLNRFAARVEVEGREALAHVPNSGRMTELLVPGAPAYLAPAPAASNRKTAYDLVLIGLKGQLVGVDARAPNQLFAEALVAGRLDAFQGFTQWEQEVGWGTSRFDFRLTGDGRSCLVETKSVNLVEGGTALFPDAPTTRGVRHIEELTAALDDGWEAAVVFVVQRADASRLSPYQVADPAFFDALQRASAAGVKTLAYTCSVSLQGMTIEKEVPVVFLSRPSEGGVKSKNGRSADCSTSS